MNMASDSPVVVLFGYKASAFTWKARWALKIKQIPYTFVTVPSMMPRPVLKDTFGLTYRKIPVLAIGKELYCDTSLIIEALEHFFPESEGYQTLYPRAADGRNYRPMIRGFASYWIDRPFFRATCKYTDGRSPRGRRTRFSTAQRIPHAALCSISSVVLHLAARRACQIFF